MVLIAPSIEIIIDQKENVITVDVQ